MKDNRIHALQWNAGQRKQEEVSLARKTLIAVAVGVAVVMAAMMLWYAVWVMLVVFAGILLGILLRTIADWVAEKTGMTPGWALGAVLLTGALVAGGLAWAMAVPVAEQFGDLAEQVPAAFKQLQEKVMGVAWVKKLAASLGAGGENGGGAIDLSVLWKRAGWALSSVFSAVVTSVLVLALGIYFAAQPRMYVNGVVALFPQAERGRVREVMGRSTYALRWWMLAQVVDMVIIGVLTGVAMWFIGVPLAMVIGVLAAIFNFVPNFGPLVSYVPAVLLAMAISPEKAVWVTVAFVVLQCLEGYVLLPLLQRKAVDTPPALLITAQVLMTVLAGAMGLVMAAPLVTAAVVAVKTLYLCRQDPETGKAYGCPS